MNKQNRKEKDHFICSRYSNFFTVFYIFHTLFFSSETTSNQKNKKKRMTDTDDTLQAVHDYVKVNDINALYVDMTEQMLMYKPENPIRFIVDYLSHKYPKQVTGGRYVRNVDEAEPYRFVF